MSSSRSLEIIHESYKIRDKNHGISVVAVFLEYDDAGNSLLTTYNLCLYYKLVS